MSKLLLSMKRRVWKPEHLTRALQMLHGLWYLLSKNWGHSAGRKKKICNRHSDKTCEGVFHLKIYNRSSLACNEGIIIPGTLMIVDRDYRGVIKVTLWNTTEEPFHVEKGDRIGQSMVDRSYKIFWKPFRGLHQEKNRLGPCWIRNNWALEKVIFVQKTNLKKCAATMRLKSIFLFHHGCHLVMQFKFIANGRNYGCCEKPFIMKKVIYNKFYCISCSDYVDRCSEIRDCVCTSLSKFFHLVKMF